MLLRHKWNNDECINCGILREIRNVKTKIAFNNGIYQYKYERKFIYIEFGKESTERPQCYTKRYDD